MAETLTEKVAQTLEATSRAEYRDVGTVSPQALARAVIAVVIEAAVRAAEREYGQAGAGGISDAIRRLAE